MLFMGSVKCCVNGTGNLVPRRSLWSTLGFTGETFPPSKLTANWYDVNGAACQKMVQSTGMVSHPRCSHRSVQHIKVGSKRTSETSDFEKWTSHLGGSRIHHMRKRKRLFVNVCACKRSDSITTGYLIVPWRYKSVEELRECVRQIIIIQWNKRATCNVVTLSP